MEENTTVTLTPSEAWATVQGLMKARDLLIQRRKGQQSPDARSLTEANIAALDRTITKVTGIKVGF